MAREMTADELREILHGEPAQGRYHVRDVSFKAQDMSGWQFTMVVFENCSFENVKFDKAVFDNSGFYGRCTLQSCSFRRTDMTGMVLGQAGSVFEDCTFDGARLSELSSYESTFERCDFGSAKLWRASFYEPSFTGSRMSGRLTDVEFAAVIDRDPQLERRRDIGELDCSAAQFGDVAFNRLTAKRCILPQSQRFIVLEGEVKEFLQFVQAGPLPDDVLARAILEADLESCLVRLYEKQDWVVLRTDMFAGSRNPAEAVAERAAETYLLQRADAFGGTITANLQARA